MRRSSLARVHQVAAVLTLTSLLAIPKAASAQGCAPIRFSNPSLGGQGESYQEAHQWRLTVGYRNLHSNQWIILGSSQPHNELGPGGSPPIIGIQTVVAEVAYAVTGRFTLRLGVPFSTGSLTRVWPDSASHRESATGLGDVNLVGEAWLLDPRANPKGNIALGLGVKAPTGSNHVRGLFYTANNPGVPFPVNLAIQLGDGGWGIILEAQAFRQVFDRAFIYSSGSYMFSPRAQSNVRTTPTSSLFWSVPDVYSGRVGLAYTVWPDQGLSISLGGRIDGEPVHDVIGGDGTARRPGYVIYADPGLALTRGRDNLTLSVPLRLRAWKQRSVAEYQAQTPPAQVGGGYAKFLIFAAYSHRF